VCVCVCVLICMCVFVCVCVYVCVSISVGLARTIYIRCIYSISAGKPPHIRSYTVYIYGSGQPYISVYVCVCLFACVCVFMCVLVGVIWENLYFKLAAVPAQRMSRNFYRVGQNHIYTVHIRYFWQETHQIYGHTRCIYIVLANPKLLGSIGHQDDFNSGNL